MTDGAFLCFLAGGRTGTTCREGVLEDRRKTEGMEMEVGGEEEDSETPVDDVGGEEN